MKNIFRSATLDNMSHTHRMIKETYAGCRVTKCQIYQYLRVISIPMSDQNYAVANDTSFWLDVCAVKGGLLKLWLLSLYPREVTLCWEIAFVMISSPTKWGCAGELWWWKAHCCRMNTNFMVNISIYNTTGVKFSYLEFRLFITHVVSNRVWNKYGPKWSLSFK